MAVVEYGKNPVDLTKGIFDYWGSGAPSTPLVNASIGSTYRQLDGGAGSMLWQRTTSGWESLQTSAFNQAFADARYAQLAASNTMTNAIPFVLNNATQNYILWNTNGVAAPAFTTRSVGAKLVLWPNITSSTTDYALGIASGVLWNSVPTTAEAFKWYGGTTLAMTLSGSGVLTTVSNIVLGGLGYLQFRGTTSSFGGIRNISGTLVEIVFADGSSYANLTASSITAAGGLTVFSGADVGGSGNGRITLNSGSTGNIGYIEWLAPSTGTRQAYMGFGSSGVNLQMEVGNFTITGNLALHTGNRDQAWSWTTTQTFSPNMLNAGSGFSTYTPDGIWNGNALPGFKMTTPGGNFLRLGYHDAGGGEYIPSIGFGALSTNYSASLLVLQTRIDRGAGAQSNNKFQIAHDGTHAWGPGSSAIDTTLSRTAANILTVSGGFIAGGANGAVASAGDICSARSTTTGTYYFGSGTSKYLFYNSASFDLNGGYLNVLAGGVNIASTFALVFNYAISGGGPRFYGADNATVNGSSGSGSSTFYNAYYINAFGTLGGYAYTDGTNIGWLSKDGNWKVQANNNGGVLFGTGWQRNDGTNTARDLACCVVSTVAPVSGTDSAPTGTIWIQW